MRGQHSPRLRGGETPILYAMSSREAAREVRQRANRAESPVDSASGDTEAVNAHYDTRLPELPRSRRLQIRRIAVSVFSSIRLLRPSLLHAVLRWQRARGLSPSR